MFFVFCHKKQTQTLTVPLFLILKKNFSLLSCDPDHLFSVCGSSSEECHLPNTVCQTCSRSLSPLEHLWIIASFWAFKKKKKTSGDGGWGDLRNKPNKGVCFLEMLPPSMQRSALLAGQPEEVDDGGIWKWKRREMLSAAKWGKIHPE